MMPELFRAAHFHNSGIILYTKTYFSKKFHYFSQKSAKIQGDFRDKYIRKPEIQKISLLFSGKSSEIFWISLKYALPTGKNWIFKEKNSELF